MPKHFVFDKLSDKKNRLKIALQVSKLGFSPLRCFVELGELERCLRYSDLKKFIVDACSFAGRLFQTSSGALLVNESLPGREDGQNGRREFPLPLAGSMRVFDKT